MSQFVNYHTNGILIDNVNDTKPIAIIYHPACSLHEVPNHPESPGRIESILKTLKVVYSEEIFFEAPLITEEQILKFHTKRHLANFLEAFKTAEKDNDIEYIDSDTAVMQHTKEASYRAAGSIIQAIDFIFQKRFRSAFCAVRPPGHHATRSDSMGFCFFNNAGIGAAYAKQQYGVEKIAVLDFDVHHGNGTEEGFTPYSYLFYGSTHEKDNYPGSGKDPSPYIGGRAKKEIDRRIVNRYLVPHKQTIRLLRNKEGTESSVREEFRIKWTQIIQEMIRFQPGLIIISAGFDAHDEDPLASCDLLEEDFAWATDMVMAAAVVTCATNNNSSSSSPVPVISILEGGYDLSALATSALVHVQSLERGYPSLSAATALIVSGGVPITAVSSVSAGASVTTNLTSQPTKAAVVESVEAVTATSTAATEVERKLQRVTSGTDMKGSTTTIAPSAVLKAAAVSAASSSSNSSSAKAVIKYITPVTTAILGEEEAMPIVSPITASAAVTGVSSSTATTAAKAIISSDSFYTDPLEVVIQKLSDATLIDDGTSSSKNIQTNAIAATTINGDIASSIVVESTTTDILREPREIGSDNNFINITRNQSSSEGDNSKSGIQRSSI